jgi:alkylhydroperoxidase/carboxymuconolactone decarboxylase family protein YurZ
MELANQDQVAGWDPKFGAMAAEIGNRAWGIPELTMREKTFLFIAADLCTGGLGFPLTTHLQMGGVHGVTPPECQAAIRHLAPYVGYPTAAVALQQLQQSAAASASGDPQPAPAHPGTGGAPAIPDAVAGKLRELDADFADLVTGQYERRWRDDPDLSPRELALTCIATDVLNRTLDDSLALHVRLAVADGVPVTDIHATLLLVSEYGLGRAWQAYDAVARHVAGLTSPE